jgi:hypothetical protein
MPNLEYNESIPKCGYENIHNCKNYMANDVKRHRVPLEPSRCERNDSEKYYCKDCNFETDLVVILKQHIREYHRKDTECVQDQQKNGTVVKNYICQKCSFKTYPVLRLWVLLWIKRLESSCFDTEEECENVRTVSCSDEEWYRCECCSFKTKEATVLGRHQTAKQSLHQKERFCCFHCKYKGKTKNHLREHVNNQHATLEAVNWFHCNECQFTSKSYFSLCRHKKLQHSADTVQWYSRDKCEYKTKYNSYLKQHKVINLSADAIQWYNCDKCEFKTKWDHSLKRHKKNHLSTSDVKWYRCDKCKFKTKRKDKLELHKNINPSADAVQWHSCNRCEYKTKNNSHLKEHKKIHLSAHAVQWYNCDKCEFKTKWKENLKRHTKLHLSADALQWHSCDKCEYTTLYNRHLERHKTIHLAGHAVQWYNCDKCEFKTKSKENLKRHQKILSRCCPDVGR